MELKQQFRSLKRAINGADTVVKTLEKDISGNKIEVELENKFEEDDSGTKNKKYSSAGYYFEVFSRSMQNKIRNVIQ